MKDKLIKILDLINLELAETNELQYSQKSYIKSYELLNNIKSPYYSKDFEINYDYNSKEFKLYTSYSNREITDEWIANCKKVKEIVYKINNILNE